MKKLYFPKDIYNVADFFLLIFCLFQNMGERKKIKNLKISVESHEILKKYCNKKGLKIYRFIEDLITETCRDKKDIYGEN